MGFSPTINTIIPQKVNGSLALLGLRPSLYHWVMDFLTRRPSFTTPPPPPPVKHYSPLPPAVSWPCFCCVTKLEYDGSAMGQSWCQVCIKHKNSSLTNSYTYCGQEVKELKIWREKELQNLTNAYHACTNTAEERQSTHAKFLPSISHRCPVKCALSIMTHIIILFRPAD